jgi:hypothetical protein
LLLLTTSTLNPKAYNITFSVSFIALELRFDSFMQQTIAKERKIGGHTDSPDENDTTANTQTRTHDTLHQSHGHHSARKKSNIGASSV